MSRTTIVAVAAALALIAADAHAGGTVLRIDGDDIYVDMGSKQGVAAGSKLTLYHVIEAVHPVSGKRLRDRFPLGELEVAKAGDRICVARADASIKPRIKVGDEVELASRPVEVKDPWVVRIERRKAERIARVNRPRTRARPKVRRDLARERALATIAAAEHAEAAWQNTLGKAPADRIQVWQSFLGEHADSPYASNARAEIARLTKQIEREKELTEQLADPASLRAKLRIDRLSALLDESLPGALTVRVPDSMYEGTAIPLAFTVLMPEAIERAWLYFRRAGEESYRRVEMARDGDAYLRGSIPGAVVAPPGVEFFVEVTGIDDGPPRAAFGTQDAPRRIDVDRKLEEVPAEIDDRSRITLFTDYVDFDGKLGGGFDQYLHAEIDFMYRFFKPVYAMRVGFGTLGGVGGPASVIDADPENCRADGGTGDVRCRRVTYSYAYTELEFRFSRSVALMLRPQFGTGTSDANVDGSNNRCLVGETDGDCTLFSAFGMRARVRFGEEQATNLTLGVGLTQDVGTVFEAAFAWDVIPRFPIKLSAQVTDQPVPEDFGVRLITDVGWRAVDWVYPSLRLAYQARNVNHAGVSGGVALNFDW